ncbi:MAG: ribosome biogenesis GTPase Der [Gemmatimonadetes bacterium]|nr:ribosome biogenesis GTPase Der [Gemmatimonadota bacterium]
MTARLPVVAIVGRPNVGKSTFFNRVVGRRIAIVDDTPGVTRDRNFARSDWAGRAFVIVDTGGLIEDSNEPLDQAVRNQALAAIEEADLTVFLVDAIEGIHPLDEHIAEILRKSGRRVLLIANKADRLPDDARIHEFWALGMGEPHPVSSVSGKGSGNLLDAIVAELPPAGEAEEETGPRVAVIGRPNVGKSSLVNKLFGETRMVVGEAPGTTRDAIDAPLRYHGRTLVFVDTAGLRRKSKGLAPIEFYGTIRTLRVVREADVCLLLLDASEGVHVQDVKIGEMAWEAGCGLIVVVNKWDLVEKTDATTAAYERHIRERAPFFQWVPILFSSALTGLRVRKALDLVLQVEEQRERRLPTSEVNAVLRELVDRQPPPHYRGRPIRLRYATQVTVKPPTFLIFVNFPRQLPAHYIRYIENSFRARWGFVGTPLRIRLRSGQRSEKKR